MNMRDTRAGAYVFRRKRLMMWTLVLFLVSVCAVMIASTLGIVRMTPLEAANIVWTRLVGGAEEMSSSAVILLNLRLPRALLAYLVGAALAVSGACMQGVFQNPMADPGLLGVSSGAAVGAALAMILELQSSWMGLGAVSVMAFLGGTAAVLLVLGISRTRGRTTTIALLLAGIAVSSFLSAVLAGMLTLNHDKMESVYLWTMGSFTSPAWPKVWLALPVTILGTALMCLLARDLNALQMGDAGARLLGVSPARVRAAALAIATLMTAAVVSISGVIGFIGLMAPHAVRALTGPDHRSLIPLSALTGGLFLLFADTIARTIAPPLELPVGVVTSFFGGPFFLILLKRSGKV